jgi:hypothetical protein
MLWQREGISMIRPIILIVLFLGGILPSAAAELTPVPAGHPIVWRSTSPDQTLPFSRSERAQSVWDSGACWRDCGSHCTWGVASCLMHDAQGHCLKLGDICDRYCQRQCRTAGGPLVPDIFDAWE